MQLPLYSDEPVAALMLSYGLQKELRQAAYKDALFHRDGEISRECKVVMGPWQALNSHRLSHLPL